MHTTVLFHGNCPDGFGAALACWQVWREEAQYLPVSYGQPCPHDRIPGHHDVYIVDFSYPATELIALQQGRPLSHDTPRADRRIVVLDHHASAQRDLEELRRQQRPYMSIVFDMEESGATLAWKWLNTRGPLPDSTHQPDVWGALEAAMPCFFHYLRDRDLWRWELDNSHAISLWLWSQPREFTVWDGIAQGFEDAEFREKVMGQGKAIKQYADTLVAQQARAATTGIIGGYEIPIVNATCLFSEVGDYLCQHGTPSKTDVLETGTILPTFVAYYMDRADGKRQWGLRSRGDFDCSLIAKHYGGGGHPGAAGFITGQTWHGEEAP